MPALNPKDIDIVSRTVKTNLLDYDRQGLRDFFTQLGEKPYRADQVMKWIYHRLENDFDRMTDLGKSLRGKLAEVAFVGPPDTLFEKGSTDGTHKWLLGMTGGNAIETVYIPEPTRGTLCVSSQVGCGLNCTFCSTATQGFNRNLSTAEIIGQVWVAAKYLGNVPHQHRRITNVVMMGMGEPLMNFDNVVAAMNLMRDDLGFGLASKRVTLSTSGLVPQIDKLSEVADVSLAVSLHAPTDALRTTLVPLNKKYPIDELLAACQRYVELASARVDHLRIHADEGHQRPARACAPAGQADAAPAQQGQPDPVQSVSRHPLRALLEPPTSRPSGASSTRPASSPPCGVPAATTSMPPVGSSRVR